jgi:hypothetical protein
MQLEPSKKFVTVETKDKKHQLKNEEYARWLCLIEALDIINRKATQFKMDLNGKDLDWVKPLAFQKYIVERVESMLDEVLENEHNVKISLNKNIKCTTSSEPVLP